MNWLLCPLPNWSFDDKKNFSKYLICFSEKPLPNISKCGKYPGYKFVYCTNNPKVMSRIYSKVHPYTCSPLRYQLSNDQLGKGHNSQFIVFTDYNLLLGVHWLKSSRQRTMQVEICFIAHHEWIANCCVSQLNHAFEQWNIVLPHLLRSWGKPQYSTEKHGLTITVHVSVNRQYECHPFRGVLLFCAGIPLIKLD